MSWLTIIETYHRYGLRVLMTLADLRAPTNDCNHADLIA